MTPQMLNGIEIWRLSRPYKDLETMVLEPIFGLVALMFGVPIMLEYDVLRGLVIVLEAGLKFILQEGCVKVLIHPPINLAGISHPLPHHTSPYHPRTTTKLHCSLHHPVTRPTFTLLLPHPFLPIRSKPIYLSLI